MSRETLEYHHDKHHKAYVDNGNKLLVGSGLEGKSLEEIVKGSFGKNAGLFNNAGQHLKIPLISDEAINIGKSWLFEEELTELFHERPQAILPHGRDELIMQATLAEQRMDTSLGCAGL